MQYATVYIDGCQLKISLYFLELLRDGFGSNPLFHGVVVEKIVQGHEGFVTDQKDDNFPVDVKGNCFVK